jgi:hypothetical protein
LSFITSYSRIKAQTLSVNGTPVFSSTAGISEFVDQAYTALNLNYPKFYKMDLLSKVGCVAAEVMMKDVDAPANPYQSAVILSNSGASLEADARYHEAAAKAPSPALFVYTLPNIVAGELCIRYGMKGESNFFVSSAYQADFLYAYIERLFLKNVKNCISGWIEIAGGEMDVFLYRIEQKENRLALPHTAENLNKLYLN